MEDLSIIQKNDYEEVKVDDIQYFDSWEKAKEECAVISPLLMIDGELFINKKEMYQQLLKEKNEYN